MRKRLPKKDSDKFDSKNYVSNRGYSKNKTDSEGSPRKFSSDKRSEGRDRHDGPKRSYGSSRSEDNRGNRYDDRKKSFGRGDSRRGDDRFDRPKRSYGNDRSDNRSGSRFDDRKKSYGDDRRSFGKDRSDDRRGGNRFDDRKSNYGGDRRSYKGDDRKKEGRYGGKPQERRFTNDRETRADEKPSFKKFGAKREVDEEIIKKSLDRQVGDPTPPRFDVKKAQSRLPPKVQQKIDTGKKEEDIRLNKYMANAGLCSRREADELIASGMIKVNGKVVTEMGYKVKPNDTVKYGKDVLSREKMMYVLLNKPKDFITTMDDPQERRTVMELVAGACKERIYPVGRLDRNTTGLLLLTNDGELTEKLTHPSNELTKIYQAELDKAFQDEDFDKLKEGVELEDGMIKPDDLAMVTPDGFVVGLKIHSGKNRVVRRMFEHLGYEVTKLDRTTFAGLTKKDLPRGKWRFLNEKEIIRLKYLI